MRGEGELCAACRTERVPAPMEPEDLFPESTSDVTQITMIPYELRPAFTGRAEALGKLRAAFEQSRDLNELSFVVIIGEPGIGKSRLVKELGRTLKREAPKARLLRGHGDGGVVPYAAFARLLARRFGIAPGDTLETSQEKIIAGVAEVVQPQRVTEVAHLLAQLMRLPFADSPIVGPLVETLQRLETRTFIAVRRFLAADAAEGPLVLCFENLDQCGTETVNLLHYLAAGLASSPVVILSTAQESIFDRYSSFGEGDVPLQRIDLGPLSDDEATSLLRELCKPLDAVPEKLLNHAPALGGSPRAVFELIRLLLESEVIVRSGSMSWKVDELSLARTELPASYDELIARRLDVMEAAERDLLEKAAVVGEVFWLDAVVSLVRVSAMKSDDPDGPTLSEIAAAGDHTRVSVARALARLVEREWITEVNESSVPGEREYRFSYPRLWHIVYNEIDDDKRRRYHRMVAQWLELRPGGRAAGAQEDVGRHLELAGETHAASQRYRRAAVDARRNFFNKRAIRLYARALACLGDSDQVARIHLWHDLGSVYELKGDFEAALGAFERMLRLAWVSASRTKAAVAFNKMGRVWRRKGDLQLALEYLRRGQELFEQAGDARGIAGSYDDIGSVLYLLGRYDEAFEQTTNGLSRRGKGGDKRSIAHSLSNLGNIQKNRGKFAEALNCHREALELRRAINDRAGVISSLNNLAVLAFEHGDFDDAREGWLAALSEAEDIGALPLQALALSNLGELALSLGNNDEARSRLEEARQISEDIDDRRLQSEATRNLALLEHNAGHFDKARALAHTAYDIAATAGLRDSEGQALVALARVSSGSLYDEDTTTPEHQVNGPEDYFHSAVRVLREIGNDSELAKGLEHFGCWKIENGDIDAGKDLLREALVIYARLGMARTSEVERVLASV